MSFTKFAISTLLISLGCLGFLDHQDLQVAKPTATRTMLIDYDKSVVASDQNGNSGMVGTASIQVKGTKIRGAKCFVIEDDRNGLLIWIPGARSDDLQNNTRESMQKLLDEITEKKTIDPSKK